MGYDEKTGEFHFPERDAKKNILHISLLILITLTIVIGITAYKQGQQRYPVAGRLIDEKIDELTYKVSFSALSGMIGQPEKTEDKVVGGVTYHMRYRVESVQGITVSRKVRIIGVVECVNVIGFKLGPQFDFVIEG